MTKLIGKILSLWLEQRSLSESDLQILIEWENQAPARLQGLGIDLNEVPAAIQARLELLTAVYGQWQELEIVVRSPRSEILFGLWHLWLPLAMQLAKIKQQQQRPLIQGILGVQGTGKTTLTRILQILLKHLGHSSLAFSLDDLYKTYGDRLQLQKVDPRIIWRGPPGTHDLDLGMEILQQLKKREPTQIPRFDKSLHGGAGDRTGFESLEPVDIVLFEGWFVGMRPIDPTWFEAAPPPIITESDRGFARDLNANLQTYLLLWQLLDRLIVLYPQDYRWSLGWRQEAERQMQAAGKPGMSDRQIADFVDYFWRALHPQLFFAHLLSHPDWLNLVIEIQQNRTFGAIYKQSSL